MKSLIIRSDSYLLQNVRASYSVLLLLIFTLSAQAMVDTNGNGLSDPWEEDFNNLQLFPLTFDPQADQDGDGWTNAKEAAAGTNPFDPNPPAGVVVPQITHSPAVYYNADDDGIDDILTPEAHVITWSTLPGKQYTLLLSTDLTASSWIPIGQPRIGTGSIMGKGIPLTQPDGSIPARMFWRVQIEDIDSDGDGFTDHEESQLSTDAYVADHDGDGLPTDWEDYYDFDPSDNGSIDSNSGPDGDPDGDGATNRQEYESNTDPNDPGDFPPEVYIISRISLQQFTEVDEDTSDNNAVSCWAQWITNPQINTVFTSAPLTPAAIGPDLATKVPYPEPTAPIPTSALKLAEVGGELIFENGDYSKCIHTEIDDEFTVTHSQLNQVRTWMKICPNQKSSVARKIPYLFIAMSRTYDCASDGYGGLTYILPASGKHPDWIVESSKVVNFEFEPNAETSKPLDVDTQLSGGTTGTWTSCSYRLIPVKVTWKAIDDWVNVSDHIDPWTNKPKGKRIFPDFKNPDDTEIRHKLQVIVKTIPELVGKAVKVKAFDIDDSTDETFDRIDPNNSFTAAVIDINKKVGNDNIIDYLGTARAGRFLSSGTVDTETAVGSVDANGETKFTLMIGMQPGSNYKVVVTEVDGHPFPAAQVTDPSLDTYLGPETTQTSKAPSSPMLTVWRKLWVENDSMGEKKGDGSVVGIPVDAYGNKLNDLHQTLQPPTVSGISYDSATDLTKFKIPQSIDPSSFSNLENGRLKIVGVSHPVDSTSQVTIVVPPTPYGPSGTYMEFFVFVKGNLVKEDPEDPSAIPVGSGFRLYDDDDTGLAGAPLPRTDLVNEQMKDYYKPAFIDVVDAAKEDPSKDHNPNKYVPFRANEFVHSLFTIANNAVDLTDRKELWTCPLVACYQREQDADIDPNESTGDDEAAGFGETNKMSPYSAYEFSAVFVETCRDSVTRDLENYPNSSISTESMIVATSAHEMGHQPGPGDGDGEIAHAEEGLMTGGVAGDLFGPNALKFRAKSILRFRISQRWSE